MTTRDLLHAAIDNLDPHGVDAVYQLVRSYAESQTNSRSGELLTLLQTVTIDGPADFSANLDSYLRGEKIASNNVH
jgi:hypothetical protein